MIELKRTDLHADIHWQIADGELVTT